MHKDAPFNWSPDCNKAFKQLKSFLVLSLILAYQNPDELSILHSDASDTGIGAVMLKVQDGHERVISYAS